MTSSQVGSQVAIGSLSWEIWGINSLCFHLKKNPTEKICLLILLSWKSDPNLPWHQLLFCSQDHCLFHCSKLFQTVAAWYRLRTVSALQPLIQICGKHSPVMNPISFILVLLGVPSLGSHTGERWHADTRERPKSKDLVPLLLLGAARWLKLFYVPCSWLWAL